MGFFMTVDEFVSLYVPLPPNQTLADMPDAYVQFIVFSYNLYYSSRLEVISDFGIAVIRSSGYPIGLLLQVLTLIFLIRGDSGYSRSAKRWFLLVLSADIFSTLYRVYELLKNNFAVANPFDVNGNYYLFGNMVSYFMFGLRRLEDGDLSTIMCKAFFFILYFPIYLSPIALTVSSLIRSYCVKFPLRAKAVLTTRVDRLLMLVCVILAVFVSTIYTVFAVDPKNTSLGGTRQVYYFLGVKVYKFDCQIPQYNSAGTDLVTSVRVSGLLLGVVFGICLFNLISSLIIIAVLFEAKKKRKTMSASDIGDSKAEIRATAMLLGMSTTLFVFFFASQVMLLSAKMLGYLTNPIRYVMLDKIGSYLYQVPYFTNSLFIAALTKRFYQFYLPCLFREKAKTTSTATTMKTIEESKMG